MSGLTGAVYSGISGLKFVAKKTENNAQLLAAAGGVATKNRIVFGTANVTNDSSTGIYTPGGVSSTGVMLNSQSGSSISTQVQTNFAIEGDGYVVVSNQKGNNSSQTLSFTRIGTFDLDNEGFFRNHAGQFLMVQKTDADGVPLSGDTSTTAGLTPATIDGIVAEPKGSTLIHSHINLPGNAAVGGPTQQTVLPIYDEIGNVHTVTITWTKTAETAGTSQTWTGTISCPDAASVGAPYNTGFRLVFNAQGELDSFVTPGSTDVVVNSSGGTVPPLTLSWNGGVAASNIVMDDFSLFGADSNVHAYGDKYAVNKVLADGRGPGKYKSVSIDEKGFIRATFDNNTQQVVARIPLAVFNNPNGLSEKNGLYAVTSDSGPYRLVNAGDNGVGSLKTSHYEGSNIDSSAVFTQIILDQNENMGDLQIIKAVNEMLEAFQRILA